MGAPPQQHSKSEFCPDAGGCVPGPRVRTRECRKACGHDPAQRRYMYRRGTPNTASPVLKLAVEVAERLVLRQRVQRGHQWIALFAALSLGDVVSTFIIVIPRVRAGVGVELAREGEEGFGAQASRTTRSAWRFGRHDRRRRPHQQKARWLEGLLRWRRGGAYSPLPSLSGC